MPERTVGSSVLDSIRQSVGGDDSLHLETDRAAVDTLPVLLPLLLHTVAGLVLTPPSLELSNQIQ